MIGFFESLNAYFDFQPIIHWLYVSYECNVTRDFCCMIATSISKKDDDVVQNQTK